jgi:hypothetical protein
VNLFTSADLLALCLARHFEQRHGASTVAVGFAPKWDVRFRDGTTVEIKLDGRACVTGLCAVEYWNTKTGASGILLSEAKVWIHCIPEDEGLHCYECDVRRLLKLIIESGVTKSGGNGSASLMKLVPLRALKEISNEDYLLKGELVDLVRHSILQTTNWERNT